MCIRDRLYIDGTFKKKKGEELEELIKWGKTPSETSSIKLIIAGIFIAVTLALIIACTFKILPFSIVILDLMINYVVIKMLTKDMNLSLIHILEEYESRL